FKRLARLFKQARHHDYDLALAFSPRPETQMLLRLVVRARTVTPSRMPHLIEMLIGGAPRREGARATDYENVLQQIGIGPSDARLRIALPAEAHAEFERMLERKGSRGGEPIVVLYSRTGASAWPVERFGETGQ